MVNYRLNPSLKNNYQHQREIIDQRKYQPISAPIGNYRLDAKGNPILPKNVLMDDRDLSDVVPENVYPMRNNWDFQTASKRESNTEPFVRNYKNSFSSSRNSSLSIRRKQVPSTQSYMNGLKKGLPIGWHKIALGLVLVYAVMIWSGWEILPFNKINQVRVVGNQAVSAQSILEGVQWDPFAKAKPFLKRRPEIESFIRQMNPVVADVKIERPDWTGINFEIKEYQPVAFVKTDSGTFPFYSSGEVLEDQTSSLASMVDQLPLIDLSFDKEHLKELGQALSTLDPKVLLEVDSVAPSSDPQKTTHVELKMKDGNIVKAIIPTLAEKMAFYPQIKAQLKERQGTIDLEVGAYFTPFQEDTNSVKLNHN